MKFIFRWIANEEDALKLAKEILKTEAPGWHVRKNPPRKPHRKKQEIFLQKLEAENELRTHAETEGNGTI